MPTLSTQLHSLLPSRHTSSDDDDCVIGMQPSLMELTKVSSSSICRSPLTTGAAVPAEAGAAGRITRAATAVSRCGSLRSWLTNGFFDGRVVQTLQGGSTRLFGNVGATVEYKVSYPSG